MGKMIIFGLLAFHPETLYNNVITPHPEVTMAKSPEEERQRFQNMSNLGSVLHEMGDLTGAKAAYERALKIDEAAFGPDHPNVATAVNNLGLVLLDQADYMGAKAAFERALKIDEAAFSPCSGLVREVGRIPSRYSSSSSTEK